MLQRMRSLIATLYSRCIIKRQTNLADHVPGCLYLNETVMATAQGPLLADGVKLCSAPPQFEHDPSQVFGCLTYHSYICYSAYFMLNHQ